MRSALGASRFGLLHIHSEVNNSHPQWIIHNVSLTADRDKSRTGRSWFSLPSEEIGDGREKGRSLSLWFV